MYMWACMMMCAYVRLYIMMRTVLRVQQIQSNVYRANPALHVSTLVQIPSVAQLTPRDPVCATIVLPSTTNFSASVSVCPIKPPVKPSGPTIYPSLSAARQQQNFAVCRILRQCHPPERRREPIQTTYVSAPCQFGPLASWYRASAQRVHRCVAA